MARIITERQLISAGSQFNGAAPGTTPTIAGGVKTYPAGTTGGKFDCIWDSEIPNLDVLGRHREVLTVAIQLADQSSWALEITNGTQDYTWVDGTTETEVLITDSMSLLPDQYLRLTTSGATAAMSMQVTFRPVEYI